MILTDSNVIWMNSSGSTESLLSSCVSEKSFSLNVDFTQIIALAKDTYRDTHILITLNYLSYFKTLVYKNNRVVLENQFEEISSGDSTENPLGLLHIVDFTNVAMQIDSQHASVLIFGLKHTNPSDSRTLLASIIYLNSFNLKLKKVAYFNELKIFSHSSTSSISLVQGKLFNSDATENINYYVTPLLGLIPLCSGDSLIVA